MPPPPPEKSISISGRSEGRSRPRVYGPRPGSSGMYNSRNSHDSGQSPPPSTTTPTIYTCRNRGIHKGCGLSFEIQDDYIKHIAVRNANDGNCPDLIETNLANPPPPQEKSPGGAGPKTRTTGLASSTQSQSATHRALYTGPVVEVDLSKSPDHHRAEVEVHAPPLPPRESPVAELLNPSIVTSTALRHPQEQSPGDTICLFVDDRPVSPPTCGLDEEEVSIMGDVVLIHNPVSKTIAGDIGPDSVDSNLAEDGSIKKILLPLRVERTPSEKTCPNPQPSFIKNNQSFDVQDSHSLPDVRDPIKGSILEEMDPNRTASNPSLSMDSLSEPMTGAVPDSDCESTPRQEHRTAAMDTSSDAGAAETATGKTQRKKPRITLPAFMTDVEVNSSKESEEGKCNTSKKKRSVDEMEILLDKRKREQYLANKTIEPVAVSTESLESLTFVTESLSKEKEFHKKENIEENEMSLMTIEIGQEVDGNFDKNENNEKKVECPQVQKFPCLVCKEMFPVAAELASHSMKCFKNSNDCEEDGSSNEIAHGGSPPNEDGLSVTDKHKSFGPEADRSVQEANTEFDGNVPIEDHENSPNEHESYIENSGHRNLFACSVCSETFVEASELASHSSSCFLNATGGEEETDTGNLFVSEEYPQDVGEDSVNEEEAAGKRVDVDVFNPTGSSINNDEESSEASSIERSNDVTMSGDSEASDSNVGEEGLTERSREKDYEDSTRSFEVSATRFQDPEIVTTTLRDALEGFGESETDSEEEDDVVELNHGKFSFSTYSILTYGVIIF